MLLSHLNEAERGTHQNGPAIVVNGIAMQWCPFIREEKIHNKREWGAKVNYRPTYSVPACEFYVHTVGLVHCTYYASQLIETCEEYTCCWVAESWLMLMISLLGLCIVECIGHTNTNNRPIWVALSLTRTRTRTRSCRRRELSRRCWSVFDQWRAGGAGACCCCCCKSMGRQRLAPLYWHHSGELNF